MKITSITVKKYRSISASEKINLSDLTVLIGPNNEGKSNILNALVCAMTIVQRHSGRLEDFFDDDTRGYDWDRDFPISLQSRKSGLETEFRLEFQLETDEVTEFKNEIGSNINGVLVIDISIGKGDPTFHVVKKGPGAVTLERKSKNIAKFIGNKIRINYIPAVRTEEASEDVVRAMVSRALRKIEKLDQYKEALDKIAELQEPILRELSSTVASTMRSFLPQVSDVQININQATRSRAIRAPEIIVNDGTPTHIERKGDGIKSLAAISLLHEVNEDASVASVLAIEEPEAHLHPEAIHRLRDVIKEISTRRQVVITTHCPLLVARDDIKSNIIVKSSVAKPAKKISEIRDAIGVRASDNLQSATFILLVEGEDDKISLDSILPRLSNIISGAIKNSFIIIDYVGGAGNLPYKASLIRSQLLNIHVLADNDDAGRESVQKSIDQGIIGRDEYTLTNCPGMPSSEFEDCVDPEIYREALQRIYGIDINVPQFRGKSKWSDRIKSVFQTQGKLWNDTEKARVKMSVAECIATFKGDPLCRHKGEAIRNLVPILERRIQALLR